MAEYSRPASGFRFAFEGIKTNAAPDSLPQNKYSYAQNVRGYNDSSTQSRPQITPTQSAPAVGGGPVLSLEPTIGIYKIGTGIFYSGTQIDSGYASGLGCSLCPFRPNASPNAYEYVFDQAKSSKVYVPASGAPVVSKVGIAEPQTAPDSCPDQYNVFEFTGIAANWTAAGTAGVLSDQTRVTDTCVALFADPASVAPSLSTRYSMRVGTVQYQTDETINVTKSSGGSTPMVVQDVLPSISTQSSVSIQAIYYFTGNTGRCVISVSQMPVDNSVPEFQGLNPIGESITNQALLAGLRRGTLVQVGTGGTAEVVFVLSVTHGTQGTVAFECSTVNTHAAAEPLIGIPAITVSFTENPALFIGQAIAATAIQSTIAAGTGTISKVIAAANNPFTHQPFVSDPTLPTAQQDDYVHFSALVSDLTLVTEIRILFDVGDGSFTQNYFYYAARPGDLTQSVAGTQTQLAGAQVAAQREAIDRGISGGTDAGFTRNPVGANLPPGGNVGSTPTPDINTSTQTSLGASQYSEIMFPISAFTRVGNDQSKTLANCNAVRIQAVATGAGITFQFGSVWVGSGGQPDVGDSGLLYFYRARPRNSVTGAKGNPSPATRYGVSPRRQNVIVSLPSAAYDSQIDTWDIFRFGGSITDWRYIGSVPSTSATFTDTIFDLAITNDELLSFDNLEPFPSIGPPVMTNTATIVGTVMLGTFPVASQNPTAFGTLSQLGNLLPGNVVQVGNQLYTLQNRPTLSSSTPTTQTYLFRFVENASNQINPLVIIQEPNMAAQPTNRVWGPDAQGVFFSVQAGAVNNNSVGLRAGLIQWTNPNDPDSAASSNTKDLCPPTEPLMNGEIVSGYPVVFSPNRAWSGIPQSDGSYAWREIPVSRGLVAEFGICSDGNLVYYLAKDGIRAAQLGNSQSLTDLDLYTLFPHEGIFPSNYTYAGNTVFAPEYKFASNVRLACVNGFLYFDYLDSNQNQRTLTCDLRKTAWSVDAYSGSVTIHAGTTNPGSNQRVPLSATRNQQLYFGDSTGAIYTEQSSPSAGSGEIVSCIIGTREEMVGDIRASKIFGDAAIDCLAAGSNMTVTPTFFGTAFGTSTTIAGSQSVRPKSPPTINLLGEQLQRSMGVIVSWTDQGTTSSLFMWEISYVTQPEDISNRITDWTDAGNSGNKFIQGFIITADTSAQNKTIAFRNGDTLTMSETFTLNMNGQQTKAFSFATPIPAHLIRLEPQDFVVWRLFGIEYVFQPMPESVLNWQCQATSFGNNGYSHVKEVLAAYSSTAPVTLTITCFDGNSPSVVTLPSTGGAYQKALFQLSPNKGLLYTFQASSTQPWQPYLRDWEVKVRQWGSSEPYQIYKNIGGVHGVSATI